MALRTFPLGDKFVNPSSISQANDRLRFSTQYSNSFLSDEGIIEENMKEQEERIAFWSGAKIRRPAVVLKSGWYGLVDDIMGFESVNEEILRYVCRSYLRNGKSLGFPCSYLNFPLHVIDMRVKFPSMSS